MDKIIQEIKDYVNSLNTPDNIVFIENELLILSCFNKAMEIVEKNNPILIQDAPKIVQYRFLNHFMEIAKKNEGKKIDSIPEARKILDSLDLLEEYYPEIKIK